MSSFDKDRYCLRLHDRERVTHYGYGVTTVMTHERRMRSGHKGCNITCTTKGPLEQFHVSVIHTTLRTLRRRHSGVHYGPLRLSLVGNSKFRHPLVTKTDTVLTSTMVMECMGPQS